MQEDGGEQRPQLAALEDLGWHQDKVGEYPLTRSEKLQPEDSGQDSDQGDCCERAVVDRIPDL